VIRLVPARGKEIAIPPGSETLSFLRRRAPRPAAASVAPGRPRRGRRGALAAVVLLGSLPARADDLRDAAAPPARRWEVHASTGLQYDSNVTLDPSGQPVPGTVADPAGGAIVVGAGGSIDLVDTDRAQVGLAYDLYQNLHFRNELQAFDLRSNRVQGTAGYALMPELWVGTQAGYQHYALGGPGYSSEPFVTPFVSLTEAGWGLTQVLYRHGDITYLSPPFEDVRDGPTDAASLSQTVYWGNRTATIGYEWGRERPRPSAGADYRYRYNQVYAGIGFTPGWQTSVDVMYLFRYENYTEPNSFADDRRRRQDHINQVFATVQRPIAPYLAIALSYYGTFDASNIDVFQYDRHIVQAELRLSY
jgi:hypothetical protein